MRLKLKVSSLFLLFFTSFILAGTPRELNIVNVSDASFTVVWYTDQAEQGYLEWGSLVPNTVAYDMRGAGTSDNIHIVKVAGLLEGNSYYFKVKSGTGTYLNDGQNFEVKTGVGSHFPGGLASLENVYQLNSITQRVNNDVLVFARVINGLGEYSSPRAIMYKNSPDSGSDYSKGYKKYFDLNAFRNELGVGFSNPKSIELVAWTAAEGFGFDGKVTINYAPATFNIYLNTANVVFYEGTPTSNPIIPTVDPIIPTINPVITINGFLLEDFEVGSSALRTNKFGGDNYAYKNSSSNMGYGLLLAGGANGTTQSYRQNYILNGVAGDIYSGYRLNLAPAKAELDITKYGAIVFFAKGEGQLAVELETTALLVNDFNHFTKAVTLSNNWQEYVISFSCFAQEDWGTKVDLMIALQRMVAVKFKAYPQVADPALKWFEIDQIYFVTGDMGTGTSANPTVFPKDRLITNFENGSQNNWGGYNYVYDDQNSPNYGNSEVTMNIINDGANMVAFVSFDVNTAFSKPFVGIGFGLDVVSTNPQDISKYSGVKFRAKGTAVINLEVNSTVYADYNRHSDQVSVVNTGTWNTYYVYFTDMTQESNWGTQVALIDVLKNALAVQLKIGNANDKGQVLIDEVEFFYNTPQKVQTLIATVFGPFANLTWDNAIGATSYLVVRNITDYPNPGSFPVIRTEGTSFVVTNGTTFREPMIDGKAYYYSVFAHNDQIDSYSGATAADKPLKLSGGLFANSTIITVDETMLYSQNGSSPISIRNGDYVNSSFTLIVTVDSSTTIDASLTPASFITLVVKAGSIIITQSFYPTFNNNQISIPVTLNAGVNNLEVSAIDWLNDTANTVVRTVVVADSSAKVGLKPGSKILCNPMPYNPNSGKDMVIAYELTAQANVEIYVYNLLGQVVWKNMYPLGFAGGSAGYNQVDFNGVDAFHDKLAVGMYFVQIVHGKSVLGTSKFLVTR
ncbi:MAG: T9SS type A sorting domain-containing protein [Candidatus Margulisbacteria bacterium]|nr:T9SS type A sorting domain-containing protein [Candidatus Margulisiibacteriota bacterium]